MNTFDFIYQEQIQKTVQLLAGYNDSEGDEFRKIVAKKIREKMEKEKKRFFPKAKEKGLTDVQIEELWHEMEAFASYSFNKSHALSYSVLTLQTAWLKANYPAEFFTANIIHELDSLDKVVEFINEAKIFGINIAPPDINESDSLFSVINSNKIRFGLSGIVGVGTNAALPIIEERIQNGNYKSVTDFIYRVNPKINVLTNMVKAGCFDSFGARAQYLFKEGDTTYLEKLAAYIKVSQEKNWIRTNNNNQEAIPLPFILEYDTKILMQLEKEVTNIYLTTNPAELYKDSISAYRSKFKSAYFGYIVDYKVFKNKNGFLFRLDSSDKTFYAYKELYGSINKDVKQFLSQFVIVKTKANNMENSLSAISLEKIEDIFPAPINEANINIPLTLKGIAYAQMLKNDFVFSQIDGNVSVNVNVVGKHLNLKLFSGYITKQLEQ